MLLITLNTRCKGGPSRCKNHSTYIAFYSSTNTSSLYQEKYSSIHIRSKLAKKLQCKISGKTWTRKAFYFSRSCHWKRTKQGIKREWLCGMDWGEGGRREGGFIHWIASSEWSSRKLLWRLSLQISKLGKLRRPANELSFTLHISHLKCKKLFLLERFPIQPSGRCCQPLSLMLQCLKAFSDKSDTALMVHQTEISGGHE